MRKDLYPVCGILELCVYCDSKTLTSINSGLFCGSDRRGKIVKLFTSLDCVVLVTVNVYANTINIILFDLGEQCFWEHQSFA